MAKIATQNIVIQLSKAVGNSHSDEIAVLDSETIAQLEAVVSELVGDDSVIVEVLSGE